MARLKRSVEKENFWRRELAARDREANSLPGTPAMLPVRVIEPEQAPEPTREADNRVRRGEPSLIEVSIPGGNLRAPAAARADHLRQPGRIM